MIAPSAQPPQPRTLPTANAGLGLESLFRVASLLCRSSSPKAVMQSLLDALCDQWNIQRGLIALRAERDSYELALQALRNGDESLRLELERHIRNGPSSYISSADQSIVCRSKATNDPKFTDRRGYYDGEAPFLGLPIHSRSGAVVGVLELQPNTTPIPDELLRVATMICTLIGEHAAAYWSQATPQTTPLDDASQKPNYGFENLVGRTAAMRLVFDQIRQVAKWNTTVLIMGESGTGKELIANAIHYNSSRAKGPFVKLNCAALPDNLLESELFGYERGAFTGATARRPGRFEQANRGTIFLDEIGEISPSFQAKLLRVLQEGEFERLGGTQTIHVDVRVIAATNKDLEAAVKNRKFREDLFYRLNVMPLRTPALRDRMDDLGELAEHLVEGIAEAQGRELKITPEAIVALREHDWPGNVRELENFLERAAIMSGGGVIDHGAVGRAGLSQHRISQPPPSASLEIDLRDPSIDERERVLAALQKAGWVQAKAARLLGMTPRQVAYRIQTLNIDIHRF